MLTCSRWRTVRPAGRPAPKRDGALFARDGVIVAVGPTAELPQDADRVINMTGQLVIPGMVNTHHHLFQNLTRAVPAGRAAVWLAENPYPIWSYRA